MLGPAHEQWESLKCTASGKHARADLWLPEHGLLSAGES